MLALTLFRLESTSSPSFASTEYLRSYCTNRQSFIHPLLVKGVDAHLTARPHHA